MQYTAYMENNDNLRSGTDAFKLQFSFCSQMFYRFSYKNTSNIVVFVQTLLTEEQRFYHFRIKKISTLRVVQKGEICPENYLELRTFLLLFIP